MARQARPDHVFIGNHTYEIRWLTMDEWDENRLDPEADACTYARRNIIFIRLYPETSESHYHEVLWHEIGHAVWDTTMLTHADLSKHDDAEEFVVGLQSPAQMFVIHHNPALMAWFMSDGAERR